MRRLLARAPPAQDGRFMRDVEAPRPWTAWHLAVGTAGLAIALGAPLVAIAAVGDELRYPAGAAALRGAWIGLYALVGLYFARSTHWRLGVSMTSLAAITAVASLDALPGSAAYTVSRIVTVALVPVAALMLVALPEARIARSRLVALIGCSIPVLLAMGAAYLTVAPTAPWSQAVSQCRGACAGSAIQIADAPGPARGILAALVVVLVGAVAVAAVILLRATRAAGPIARRTLTPVAWLTVAWGGPLSVGLVAVAVAPGPERLNPYLIATGIIRAALPLAILAVVLAHAARTGAIRNELTSRLAGAKDPARVERVLSEVLRDPSLRLAFRDGSGWIDVEGRRMDADGAAGDRGWIAVGPTGDEAAALTFDPALRPQEERIRVVAALCAAALERAGTEAELRAMRRRLVSVAEQERLRIERSLHDGAQQRLIGMTIRMAIARETIAGRPETALTLLRELGADAQRALQELRELAHGLHPPVLVDHGLAEALRSAARHSPVPVEVAIADIERLDPLQEAAAYFCCAEALQNALKHGGPRPRISIGLARDGNGGVEFEVADDGPGFTVGAFRPGTGLMGMRDRVEGVDGTLTIDSAPGRGTRVRGRIPVERVAPDEVVDG